MLDTYARKPFDILFSRIASFLLKRGLRANQVTLMALVIGLLAGFVLYLGLPIPAVCLLWLSGLLDAVDGSMARKSGSASKAGAALDIVSDRIVELAVLWVFFLCHPDCRTALFALLSAVLISMCLFLTTAALIDPTVAGGKKKSFYYQAGLMERTEGFLASTLMMLLQRWLLPLTWLYAALILLTIVQRALEIRRLLMKGD